MSRVEKCHVWCNRAILAPIILQRDWRPYFAKKMSEILDIKSITLLLYQQVMAWQQCQTYTFSFLFMTFHTSEHEALLHWEVCQKCCQLQGGNISFRKWCVIIFLRWTMPWWFGGTSSPCSTSCSWSSTDSWERTSVRRLFSTSTMWSGSSASTSIISISLSTFGRKTFLPWRRCLKESSSIHLSQWGLSPEDLNTVNNLRTRTTSLMTLKTRTFQQWWHWWKILTVPAVLISPLILKALNPAILIIGVEEERSPNRKSSTKA